MILDMCQLLCELVFVGSNGKLCVDRKFQFDEDQNKLSPKLEKTIREIVKQ